MCAYVFCIRNGNTVAIILFCSFFFFRTLFPKPLFLPSLLPLMPSLWHGTAPSHTFSISFYNNSEKWDIQAIHSIIKLYWNVHWIRWKKKKFIWKFDMVLVHQFEVKSVYYFSPFYHFEISDKLQTTTTTTLCYR